jgi:hypothetical protein
MKIIDQQSSINHSHSVNSVPSVANFRHSSFGFRHSPFVSFVPWSLEVPSIPADPVILSKKERRRRDRATWNNLATSPITWPLREFPDDFARKPRPLRQNPSINHPQRPIRNPKSEIRDSRTPNPATPT